MEALKIKDLSFKYPQTEELALKDISLTLKSGSFNVLAGATGSGKSTLLRLIKRELAPLGERSGSIIIGGTEQSRLDERTAAAKVGFVMQDPEQQIVCDKVWHELVFLLESLGESRDRIAVKAAETASYFNLGGIYERDTASLSGGQKQLLNLSAVMTGEPELLILDEPTAQLDPIAAAELIGTVKKLSTDLGVTVLIAEHRLEELTPLADTLIIMDKGRVTHCGAPGEVIQALGEKSSILSAMPAPARLYRALGEKGECPLNISGGRELVRRYGNGVRALERENYTHSDEKALELRDVYFRFEKNAPDVLKGLSLSVYRGEIFCILGANGSGKTTAVSVCAGLLKAYSGSVRVFGKRLKDYKNRTLYKECLTLVPQDVTACFIKNTVREELEVSGVDTDSLPFDLSPLYDKHPYDLSGGERQLLALAKALGNRPKLLLLDEVTKGMDASLKLKTADILRQLKAQGITCVLVTHDIEFAAMCADRCAMFFNGEAVSCMTPGEFFGSNSYYTTAACRMARGHYDNAVTVEDLVTLCRKNGKAG